MSLKETFDSPEKEAQKLKVASLVEILAVNSIDFTPQYHSGSLEGASVGDLLNLAREVNTEATIEVLEKSIGLSCDEVKKGLIEVYRKFAPSPVELSACRIHGFDVEF